MSVIRKTVKKLTPKKVFRLVEPVGHGAEAVAAQATRRLPAHGLKIIGITGTDGKTTTATILTHVLQSAGLKTAKITTVSVDYADGKGDIPSPTHMTTPSVWKLTSLLKKIKKNQPDWVVLETSSHALAQNRVLGLPYEVAVLTNMSPEHLDYHKTFERYVSAKLKLFQITNKRRGLRVGAINADDPVAGKFKKAINYPVTYGVDGGDIRASDIQLRPEGSMFTVNAPGEQYIIKSHLTGLFNVYNILAVIAVARAVGLSRQQIEHGVSTIKGIPGRFESVETGQDFSVIIDYAVTPAALEQVLLSAKAVSKGQVSIVFGATGDRDKSKRPIMGEIVAKLADKIYLTDDETYTEDPEAIRKAVMIGIRKAGGAGKTKELGDRLEAISQCLSEAKAGDVILITGLGHQKDRNMGGKLLPWSDKEIVKNLLNKAQK